MGDVIDMNSIAMNTTEARARELNNPLIRSELGWARVGV
jgi:hypothetical protein